MPYHEVSKDRRTDALAQFKAAHKMLAEGQTEMTSALDKIKSAQKLIEQSTDVIRATWVAERPGRTSKKK
jgi:hypothetical protein